MPRYNAMGQWLKSRAYGARRKGRSSMKNFDPLGASAGTMRQGEIYIGGMLQKQSPSVPSGQRSLEERAQAVMSEVAFAYVAGGAGRESTMRHNLEAFDRHRIVPRMLRDVGTRDMSIELLANAARIPFSPPPLACRNLRIPMPILQRRERVVASQFR